MACILHIETSTKIGSIALSLDNEILFEKIDTHASSHARLLGVFAQEAINEYVRKQGLNLDAVSVSSGPGSYTGLRIGVSEAKGICYGLNIPLIAVPTVKVIAENFLSSDIYKEINKEIDLLCPMMDARRMEVYSAVYDLSLNEIKAVQAEIVEADFRSEYLAKNKMAFFGDGSDKTRDIITSPNALFVSDIVPLARNMIRFAEKSFKDKELVDTAYFEPFYLKEFQATTPKSRL